VEITLAIALILQVAFFAVWITAAVPASLAYILIALAAFAMGLQANAIRSLSGHAGPRARRHRHGNGDPLPPKAVRGSMRPEARTAR
jgi:hypothetical protein